MELNARVFERVPNRAGEERLRVGKGVRDRAGWGSGLQNQRVDLLDGNVSRLIERAKTGTSPARAEKLSSASGEPL